MSINNQWPGYPQIQPDIPINSNFQTQKSPSSSPNFNEHKVTEITSDQINTALSEAEKKGKTGQILGVIGGTLIGVALLAAGIALTVLGLVTLNPLLIAIGTPVLVCSGLFGVVCGEGIVELHGKITDCPRTFPADNVEFCKFVNESEDRKKLVNKGGLRLVAEAFSKNQELDFKKRCAERRLKEIKVRHEKEIQEQELRLSEIEARIIKESN